tara:strand:+ start:5294 stop:5914 length:621 start_codon:yes stop_codon:yes gene_type:complete
MYIEWFSESLYDGVEYNRLAIDEERDLVQRCKDGDKKAREILFNNKILLIKQEILDRGYIYNSNMSYDDLMHEGYFAFNIAIKKFDLDNGASFNTYLMFWVRQKLSLYYYRYKNIIADKSPQYEKNIEVVEEGNVPLRVYTDMDEVIHKEIDFSQYNTLTEREQDMMHMYFNKDQFLREIGEKYGKSRERIRVIIEDAKNKIKRFL